MKKGTIYLVYDMMQGAGKVHAFDMSPSVFRATWSMDDAIEAYRKAVQETGKDLPEDAVVTEVIDTSYTVTTDGWVQAIGIYETRLW